MDTCNLAPRANGNSLRDTLCSALAIVVGLVLVNGGAIVRGAEPDGMPLPDGAVLRIGTTFLCHTGSLPTIDFTPDGKCLVTAAHSRWVNLWDTTTGVRTKTIKMGTPALTEARFSADGKRLLTAEPNLIQIWDIASGLAVGQIPTEVPPGMRVVFDRDGESLLALEAKPDAEKKFLKVFLRTWNLRTLAAESVELTQIQDLPPLATTRAGLSPGGTWVAWHNPATKEFCFSRAKPNGEVFSVPMPSSGTFRFSADEKWLAKTQVTTTVRTAAAPNAPAPAPIAPNVGPNPRINAAPSTITVVPTSIKVWNLENPKEPRTWELGHGRVWLLDMAISNDGKYVATAGSNGMVGDPKGTITIRIWDAATGNLLREFDYKNVIGGNVVQTELMFAPQGDVLAVEAGPFVQLWNWREGKAQLPQVAGQIVQRATPIWFRPDGKQLAGMVDHKVLLWDAATGKSLPPPLLPILGTSGTFVGEPQGDLLAYVDQQNDNKVVRIVQYPTAEPRGVLPTHTQPVTSLHWLPGDNRLATVTSDGTIRIWNTASQQIIFTFSTAMTNHIWGTTGGGKTLVTSTSTSEVISRTPATELVGSGTIVITYSATQLQGWNIADGKQVDLGMSAAGKLANIKISPDGKYLAGIDLDRRAVVLWNLEQAELIRAIPIPCDRGYAFDFSPDSRLLAQVEEATDRLFLWDTASGGDAGSFDMQGPGAIAVAFSPDGQRLATTMSNNTLVIWDIARARHEPFFTFHRRTAADLEAIWSKLSGLEYFKAIVAIGQSGDQGVDLIAEKLGLKEAVSGGDIEKLLANLDDDQFKVREQATTALIKLGSAAGPRLKAALQATDSPEVHKRLERILAALPQVNADNHQIPARAVEILEFVATPEAKQRLKQIASGKKDVELAERAQAALDRLARIEKFESENHRTKPEKKEDEATPKETP